MRLEPVEEPLEVKLRIDLETSTLDSITFGYRPKDPSTVDDGELRDYKEYTAKDGPESELSYPEFNGANLGQVRNLFSSGTDRITFRPEDYFEKGSDTAELEDGKSIRTINYIQTNSNEYCGC
ncbi:hypothetical protein ACFL0W_05690 [Nanoarchaeota archaeon]